MGISFMQSAAHGSPMVFRHKLNRQVYGLLIMIGLASPAFGEPHMKLSSTAFTDQASIPSLYTCEGKDISPALAWDDVPNNTKSLVLIVDDPDAPDPAAPKMTWVHWVLYNLPVSSTALVEAVTSASLPKGTFQGLNDWKRPGYGGPCPPIGRHRYFFKLYALDTLLPHLGQATKADVERAMQGHVIEQTELVGTYQKHSGK